MRIILFLLAGMLAACGSNAVAPVATPGSVTASPPATGAPSATPPPTVAPSATPTDVPTSTPSATPTVAPTIAPTTTPDPFAEFDQFTIDGLRDRTYGGGSIEILAVLEETESFTRYLFVYPSDGLRITGMLNRPRGAGPFPVVILNHGYYPLDVYRTGNGTQRAADYLAQRGYLTLAPDFRSHAGSDDAPNVFRAGHVIDTLNLIPLAQQLPEARPGKILMWGHSNGGAITSKVITVSDQIDAALIYAPASSNIVEDYQFRVERWTRRQSQPPGERSGVIDRMEIEFPVRPEGSPELYTRLSPLTYVDYVTARVLIIWGDRDEIVPRNWPEDLYLALRAAGKDVAFEIYPGQPHSFDAAGNAEYLPRMQRFFEGSQP